MSLEPSKVIILLMFTETGEPDGLACSFYRNQSTFKGRIELLLKCMRSSVYEPVFWQFLINCHNLCLVIFVIESGLQCFQLFPS